MYLRGPNNSAHLGTGYTKPHSVRSLGNRRMLLGGLLSVAPTIFLCSSHPKKPAPQPILWAITGRTGLGRFPLRACKLADAGFGSECRPITLSYMNDTDGDLPRCLFPKGSGWVFTLVYRALEARGCRGGVTECRPTTFLGY